MSDWDLNDGDILRQVLAQSQQEYLDSLKRKAKEINSESTNKASSSGYCYDESYASCSTSSPNKKQKVHNESNLNVDKNNDESDQCKATVDKKTETVKEDVKDDEIVVNEREAIVVKKEIVNSSKKSTNE